MNVSDVVDLINTHRWEQEVAADASLDSRQVGGTHYLKAVQPWDAMEAWMSEEAFSGYLQGNVIKYISRYRDKNGLQDLQKARHYLDKLIELESPECR